jgi:hypothetical protein
MEEQNTTQEKPLEFKARMEDGHLVIDPIIEKDEQGNVKIHMPSLSLINKFNTGGN